MGKDRKPGESSPQHLDTQFGKEKASGNSATDLTSESAARVGSSAEATAGVDRLPTPS